MSQSDNNGLNVQDFKDNADAVSKNQQNTNNSQSSVDIIASDLNIDAEQLHRQVLESNQKQDQIADATNIDTNIVDSQSSMDDEHDLTELYQSLEGAMRLHSIRDFIRFCVTQLRTYDIVIAQGSNDVFAEASAIVLHTLNLEWSADEQILDCRLTEIEKSAVLSLLQQRIESRKPLSYLINLAYFCGLPFYVDERVLIPRSPIAELIRQQFYPFFEPNHLATPIRAQSVSNIATTTSDSFGNMFVNHGLQDKQLVQPTHILDLCTGSGCIAVALATKFPEAQVDATDIDRDALQVAYVNVEHHGLDYQINLIESDLFAKLPSDEQYDLIVTNPPYVDAASMAELPPEFLYEPEHALAAGQDGLDLVHRILHAAPAYLSDNGLLVCEVGDSEWALSQAYPEIRFNWLNFALGGSGVFAIDKQSLLQHRELFAQYVAMLDDAAQL